MWGRKFLVAILINFVYMITLIPLVFSVTRFFYLELILLAAFLILSFLAATAMYFEHKWSWPLYTFLFAAGLLNMMFVYFFSARIYLFAVSVIATVVGFLYSVLSLESTEEYEYDKYKEKVDKGVGEEEVIVEEITPLKGDFEKPKEKMARNYLGSLKRAEYHVPNCLAAKRITGKNKVWFATKEEAEEQGYSKHSCVK